MILCEFTVSSKIANKLKKIRVCAKIFVAINRKCPLSGSRLSGEFYIVETGKGLVLDEMLQIMENPHYQGCD